MASDLSPSEKEEREVERLIDKEPAPSRKYTENRGPKHDNRRRRMKVEDSDLKNSDKDLSLNRKTQGAFHDIAIRMTLSASYNQLKYLITKFTNIIQRKAPKLAKDFMHYIENNMTDSLQFHKKKDYSYEVQQLKKMMNDFRKDRKHLTTIFMSAEQGSIPSLVVENWPKDKNDFALKAALIYAIDKAIDEVPIPQAYKIPFLRGDVKDNLNDANLLRKLIESASKRHTFRAVGEDVILLFAELASAYKILQKDTDNIDHNKLSEGIDELSVKLREQAKELVELGSILEAWNYSADNIKPVKRGKNLTFEMPSDFDAAVRSIDEFFSSNKDLVNPIPLMKELGESAKKKFGEIPPELEGALEGFKRAATSNEISFPKIMTTKTAQFHGVDDRRGNLVSPPNSSYRSFDSRSFTEENYKAIVAYAKALLDQPWLKYDWDGSSKDAQYRAALDLAIHMADDCLYQNKIDVDTYNLLYVKLANLKVDTFKETVIPVQDKVGQNRSATMRQSQEYKNIVRIASDLRKANPKAAFEIMKSIRGLVATEVEEESGVEAVSTSPGDTIEFRSMGDDDFKKLKSEIKRETDKLLSEEDVETFFEGFDKIISEVEKKTASLMGSRVPLTVLIKLASSNEMLKNALQPIFVAAKKKQEEKTSKKKTSKKKTSKKSVKSKGKEKPSNGKKAPPFGGKKAPPFGGKGKKVKASQVKITREDLAW